MHWRLQQVRGCVPNDGRFVAFSMRSSFDCCHQQREPYRRTDVRRHARLEENRATMVVNSTYTVGL